MPSMVWEKRFEHVRTCFRGSYKLKWVPVIPSLPQAMSQNVLDIKIAALADAYRPLAMSILKEAIRIPADFVERKDAQHDPKCGLSNHEHPRLLYLRSQIISQKAVEQPEDVFFDDFGNLVWSVQDRADQSLKKKVIYFDGHTDTVNALRSKWHEQLGAGIDAYNGVQDPAQVNDEALKKELGYVPPRSDWEKYVVFGRGSADQLCGVVDQIIATKILLELKSEGFFFDYFPSSFFFTFN